MGKQKIGIFEKLSFGGGDMANCITFGVTSAYLSYYYTDTVGISVAAVGLILGISRVAEAFANLFTGIAIDRTNSRLGKTKPFLYATTLPLMLCFFLMFTVPDISLRGMTVYASVTYLLFCLLYAVNNTAYGTLLSLMTGDAVQRRSINNYKLMGIGLGTVAANACTLPLVSAFGGKVKGYSMTGLLFALVSFLFLMNCTVRCKERIAVSGEGMTLGQSLKSAVRSRSWLSLCLVALFITCSMTLRTSGLVYYAKYVMEREELASVLLAMSPVSMLVSSPFIGKALDYLGNRKCMILGGGGMAGCLLGMFAAGPVMGAQMVLNFLFGVFSNLCTGPMYTACSDTMDEVEYLTGKRPQGIMTSVMMCTNKLGIAFAPLLSALILETGGYQAGLAQSPAGLAAIRGVVFWAPGIMACMGILSAAAFGLDKEHEHMTEELEKRRNLK